MSTAVSDVRARVEALPAMASLLPALEGLPPAYLVGGAVRDLLRGARSVDLDLALEGNAEAAARELAARLGGEAKLHERFGTATVRAGELSFDLAATRRERYRAPGALPEVEPAPLDADLGRRDFTINAMAVSLAAGERGRLHDPHGGRADLDARVVRVLHRHSFVDDPTRLLRAVRYEARLELAMDRDTESLARSAIADGLTGAVSTQRVGAELLPLLGEPRLEAALARLAELGLDRALDPALAVDPRLASDAATAAGRVGADPSLAALAALVAGAPEELAGWLGGLGVSAARDRAARAARAGPEIARSLAGDADRPPSMLRDLLAPEPPEALALALARGAPPEPIFRYLDLVRGVRLEIGGDDLLAAGVPQSPALGHALEETLRRKLDGEVEGREDELRLALALARGEGEGR
jgi:tRNA nucleotidyltransferase (CCA-adding enzyme)